MSSESYFGLIYSSVYSVLISSRMVPVCIDVLKHKSTDSHTITLKIYFAVFVHILKMYHVHVWINRSGSILIQEIACWPTAPSHYRNQCWLIIIVLYGIHFEAIWQKRCSRNYKVIRVGVCTLTLFASLLDDKFYRSIIEYRHISTTRVISIIFWSEIYQYKIFLKTTMR